MRGLNALECDLLSHLRVNDTHLQSLAGPGLMKAFAISISASIASLTANFFIELRSFIWIPSNCSSTTTIPLQPIGDSAKQKSPEP